MQIWVTKPQRVNEGISQEICTMFVFLYFVDVSYFSILTISTGLFNSMSTIISNGACAGIRWDRRDLLFSDYYFWFLLWQHLWCVLVAAVVIVIVVVVVTVVVTAAVVAVAESVAVAVVVVSLFPTMYNQGSQNTKLHKHMYTWMILDDTFVVVAEAHRVASMGIND